MNNLRKIWKEKHNFHQKNEVSGQEIVDNLRC